ncbi:hypothetical protein [Frigoriglobus tundricola]|uniref:Uncharacterized protein n=1 Tax=Frigoriglobus tundricola TaxID=2774151 RepID=A0A6M5Z0K9_9BACT|nr:hypothetical protein [Frigoriglobus tundricola]QJW99715.1 hypothetical protein FTUN_7338 [Frigoriglobus tundricola]
MPTRLFGALALVFVAPVPARAAVLILGNYTAETVPYTIAEPGAKARNDKVPPNSVLAVHVTGPADITFTAKGRATTLRLDPYNAYLFLPDPAAGLRLEGLELPGEALERDGRGELNPAPRDPVKVPVTLLVDDCDPRAEKYWQEVVRKRFDAAAEVIESACGIRPEFAGFDTWTSDPEAKNLSDLLAEFEKAVKVKPGALAIGYTSRRIDEKVDPAFGVNRGLGNRHVLVREWLPKSEPERVEVMVHFLAQALGGVGSPDAGSALRPKLGDGYINHASSVLRLDPLNALALNLWAQERRRDPAVEIGGLSAVNRHRMTRVYKALLKAAPGDALATAYLNDLDADAAKRPDPIAKNPDRPPVKLGVRTETVRKIVGAVTERAKQNAAAGPRALTGDDLTAAYVRAAAQTAVANEGPEMVSAFLVALGVALDDTGALAADALTAAAVKDAETAAERTARLEALGNPTLAGRRDLCRRFFIGCATGELLPPAAAENAAIGRAVQDLEKPSGLCVPVLAADLAGIAFAQAAQSDAEMLRDVVQTFPAKEYLPPLSGLKNGLSAEKFEEQFGGATGDRFVAQVADIRKRLKAMRAYK